MIFSLNVASVTIGIIGSLLGAPLVAKMNHTYARRKERREHRRLRISEWRTFVTRSAEIGVFYGANGSKSYDLRDTDEYGSLEPHLDQVCKSAVKDLMGPYCLVGDEKNQWPDRIRGNYEDVLSLLRSEIARLEEEWGLI